VASAKRRGQEQVKAAAKKSPPNLYKPVWGAASFSHFLTSNHHHPSKFQAKTSIFSLY
jgi:hypothetical protein